MWLKLDLDEVDFRFRINKYSKSTQDRQFDDWCRIDLLLQSGSWLNVRIHNQEIMLSYEVEELQKAIDDLLHNKLTESKRIELIEPDFEFFLDPKSNISNDPDVVYVKPGYEIIDESMDFYLSSFENGYLSANRIVLFFDKRDLEKLLCYLRLITGDIDENNRKIKRLIAEGTLFFSENEE